MTIGVAAADVQAGREIVPCLDAGKELHDANDVGLAELRNALRGARRDLHRSHAWPRFEHVAFDGPRLCPYGAEHRRFWLEPQLDARRIAGPHRQQEAEL